MRSFCCFDPGFPPPNTIEKDGRVSIRSLIRTVKEATQANQGLSEEEYDEILKALHHKDQETHNLEVRSGLAKYLYKLLDIVLPRDKSGEQVGYLITAFALFLQCTDEYKHLFYRSIGDDLLHTLLSACDMCLSGSITEKHSSNLILATTTKVLGIFCKIEEIRNKIVRNREFRNTLVDIIYSTMSQDARIYAIWSISILALNDENRLILTNHRDVVDALIRASDIDDDPITDKEISAALLNLSALSKCHTRLAKHPGFLKVMVKFLRLEGETQFRAAGTIRNLASSEGARPTIVNHDEGSIIGSVCDIMIGSDNEKASARAAGAIKNMSFSNNSKVQKAMLNYPELLKSLEKATSSKDEKIRSYAAIALSSFADCCHYPMASHEILLGTLVSAAMIPRSYLGNGYAYILSSAYLLQAMHPKNVKVMAKNQGILEGLSSLLSSEDSEAMVNAKKVIDILSFSEKDNKEFPSDLKAKTLERTTSPPYACQSKIDINDKYYLDSSGSPKFEC
mmetsp:Transcript_28230/g.64582  ORF Transcript_28230/g.64582 Transcript_28230/m.64582 type:complete len:510 (-) Transcript_28230:422-1951(-)